MDFCVVFISLVAYYRSKNDLRGIIFPAACFVTALVGFFGFQVSDFAHDLPFAFGDVLTYEELNAARYTLNVAALASLLTSTALPVPHHEVVNGLVANNVGKFASTPLFVKRFSLLLCVVSITCFVYAYDVTGLLLRDEYIPGSRQTFKTLGSITFLFGFALYAFSHPRHLSTKLLACIFAVVFLAMASRSASAVVALYYGSSLLMSRVSIVKDSVIAVILIALSLVLALQFRQGNEHGLVAYLDVFFEVGVNLEILRIAANYVTSYSYSLIAYVIANQDYVTSETFWISISPLPGELIGWGSLARDLRVNLFVPYAGIAELRVLGWSYLISYIVVATVISRLSDRLLTRTHPMIGFLGLPFYIAFTYSLMQYNLRSATRFIYYHLVIALFIYALIKLLRLSNRRIKFDD